MLIALGVDPGLRATGYCILQGDHLGCGLRDLGVLQMTQGDLSSVLADIHRQMARLLEDIRPDVVVLEDLFAHERFPRTALALAHVRGAIALAAANAGVGVETLTPAAVKRALTGNGRASKGQVQAMVVRILGLSRRPVSHSADAAALALTALSRRGVALTPPRPPHPPRPAAGARA
ncbi:MAG TPA: crossover junction endodeoxyribonuclease RuvC [bacterium]|jgi:crossover junction endodeoxyribonuclease RuvC|nr:crossover junction endodeoxyribonuclease RuvC [bacterium]